ncbi:MAG: glycine-rich domain-containing protein [Sphingomonadales bacterium]
MFKNLLKNLAFISLFAAAGKNAIANNITVSNVILTGQNTSAGVNNAANFALIQFDLSWENSWRVGYATGVNNWDAAWVFVKYRVNGGAWNHAWLNNSGHSAGSGTTLDIDPGLLTPGSAFNATTNPALGCFFYRNAAGTGNISNTGLQLRWNYGANGISDNSLVEVKVFAIEMAYVPQGGFDAGESFPDNPWQGDPSASSVTFQLTGNGSNGGTTFTDASAAANAVSRNGNTAYTTAQAKFGGSSVYFDGNNDNLLVGAANDADFDFGSGDFTIELYVRPDGTGGGSPISYVGGPFSAEGWAVRTSNQLHFVTYDNSSNPTLNLSGGTILANTWYHIAIARSGNTITGYIDGAQVFTTTKTGSLHATGGQTKYFQLGEQFYNSGNDDWAGYISHVRVTKGVARPVTDFGHSAYNLLGHLRSTTESQAMRIGSESAITLGGSASGNMISQTLGQTTPDDFSASTTQSLGASFPKGQRAFYCMKSEISQQQYVNFLNTLTRTQQAARVASTLAAGTTSVTNRYVMSNTSTMSNRNGIRCDATIHTSNPIIFYCDFNGNGTGGEAGDGCGIACNFLSWADGAAYMDWAGLRPMTELEFEKAAHGSRGNIMNEYAWGSNSATAAATLNNSGFANETVSTGNAIYGSSALGGPLRTGSFAKTGSGRSAAGASLYGILDLSGNLEERVVNIGSSAGRSYTGIHGNGSLSTTGDADASLWPSISAGGVGFRGGAWNTDLARLRTADRMRANAVDATRAEGYGFRGVRTVNCIAPATTVTISGNTSWIYNTSSPNQTFTASGGTNYLWSLSSPFTLNSGQGTNSISVTSPNAFTRGVIFCSDVNACGAGSETRLDITVVAAGQNLATGGTITFYTGNGTNGANGVIYAVHSFTTLGASTFVPLVSNLTVDYLVIGGGGGGAGSGNATTAGGGGAGGYRTSVTGQMSGGGANAEPSISLTGGTQLNITVGSGGTGGTGYYGPGAVGGASSISGSGITTISALGGGGGGHGFGNPSVGGSGGGGSGTNGASGTVNQGYAGGNAIGGWDATGRGGGGGGAGGIGGTGSTPAGGTGGAGVSSNITGSAVIRAGGGGGSGGGGAAGAGTAGGGNGGTHISPNGSNATANTGGGGGASSAQGGNLSGVGGNGGSGIVILRYAL